MDAEVKTTETPELPWPRIADALPSGLVVIDHAETIVHWNGWMAKHSGVAANAALGRRIEAVLGEGVAMPFRRAVGNVLKHRLPVVLSNVLHRDPLPLYRQPGSAAAAAAAEEGGIASARMPQSLTLMPIQADDGTPLCVVQITDTSMFVKRERLLKSASDRLSKEAVIDGLTGVYNRKHFNEKLPIELSRCLRQGLPLSLLMIDVDAFKSYNDTYGHPAGDRVLVAIVTAASAQLNRGSDILARYGGEEFVVILPGCNEAGALRVAERIRAAIAELRIPHARSDVADHITLSVGASTCEGVCTQKAVSEAGLLESADRALYGAKHGGRDAVRWLAMAALAA
jgi:diguanylate cyclase (GGDEF)-like protein